MPSARASETRRARSTSPSPRAPAATARKSAASATSWIRSTWAPASTPWAIAASVPASRAAGVAPGERADEVLAGDGQKDRATELVQRRQRAEHGDRLRRGLGEVRSGIDHQLLEGDPTRQGQRDAVLQETVHVSDDPSVEPSRAVSAWEGRSCA